MNKHSSTWAYGSHYSNHHISLLTFDSCYWNKCSLQVDSSSGTQLHSRAWQVQGVRVYKVIVTHWSPLPWSILWCLLSSHWIFCTAFLPSFKSQCSPSFFLFYILEIKSHEGNIVVAIASQCLHRRNSVTWIDGLLFSPHGFASSCTPISLPSQNCLFFPPSHFCSLPARWLLLDAKVNIVNTEQSAWHN